MKNLNVYITQVRKDYFNLISYQQKQNNLRERQNREYFHTKKASAQEKIETASLRRKYIFKIDMDT